MRVLLWPVITKEELIQKAKLLISWSVYNQTLGSWNMEHDKENPRKKWLKPCIAFYTWWPHSERSSISHVSYEWSHFPSALKKKTMSSGWGIPPWHPPMEVDQSLLKRITSMFLSSSRKTLVPPEEQQSDIEEWDVWTFLLHLLPLQPNHEEVIENGWMDGRQFLSCKMVAFSALFLVWIC